MVIRCIEIPGGTIEQADLIAVGRHSVKVCRHRFSIDLKTGGLSRGKVPLARIDHAVGIRIDQPTEGAENRIVSVGGQFIETDLRLTGDGTFDADQTLRQEVASKYRVVNAHGRDLSL